MKVQDIPPGTLLTIWYVSIFVIAVIVMVMSRGETFSGVDARTVVNAAFALFSPKGSTLIM